MENHDFTRLNSEPLNGEEVDLQGTDHCHSPTCQSQNQDSSLESPRPNKDKEIMEKLKLGMEFNSDESAYRAYGKFGGENSFNVRKRHRKKNKVGLLTRVSYCCSKQGHRRNNNEIEDPSYFAIISRAGCDVHMACLLQKNGKFKIVSFNASHNHDLVITPMKHMLKINCQMSKALKLHADDADKSGIQIKATVEFMGREVGGRENLGFLDKDYRNYINKKRNLNMEKGDVGAILQYFQKILVENSSSFYSMQLDEDDMITNIFWADARLVSDYSLFGEVICLDTTYRTNEYGRPSTPFLRVNHHKQTVVFGAALLYDESANSFRWPFQTFLEAMSEKQPRTILTDQSATIAKAISEVFPETHHQLGVWHIYQNAAKNLSHVFHISKQFAYDFGKCVYDHEDEEK